MKQFLQTICVISVLYLFVKVATADADTLAAFGVGALIVGVIIAVICKVVINPMREEERIERYNVKADYDIEQRFDELRRMREGGASEEECQRFYDRQIAKFEPLGQYWDETEHRWQTDIDGTGNGDEPKTLLMINPTDQHWDSELLLWADVPENPQQIYSVLEVRERLLQSRNEELTARMETIEADLRQNQAAIDNEKQIIAENEKKLAKYRQALIEKRHELEEAGEWDPSMEDPLYIGVGYGADRGMFGKN